MDRCFAQCLVALLVFVGLPIMLLTASTAANREGAAPPAEPSTLEGPFLLHWLRASTARPGSSAAGQEYVRKARQEGQSDEAIAATMRSAGWPEEEIRIALQPTLQPG